MSVNNGERKTRWAISYRNSSVALTALPTPTYAFVGWLARDAADQEIDPRVEFWDTTYRVLAVKVVVADRYMKRVLCDNFPEAPQNHAECIEEGWEFQDRESCMDYVVHNPDGEILDELNSPLAAADGITAVFSIDAGESYAGQLQKARQDVKQRLIERFDRHQENKKKEAVSK